MLLIRRRMSPKSFSCSVLASNIKESSLMLAITDGLPFLHQHIPSRQPQPQIRGLILLKLIRVRFDMKRSDIALDEL
jgi:hypothetical protein